MNILHELEGRKQVEILGGGYYDPLFPLLFPVDRNGQIEMLSSELRAAVGKRPRGMTLCAGSWEAALTASLQTYGIEYVLMDSASIPPHKQLYLPLIMADRGKTVDIVPVYDQAKPLPNGNAGQYLKDMYKKASRPAVPEYISGCGRMVTVLFSHGEFKALLESGTLSALYEAASRSDGAVQCALPNVCRRLIPRIPAYIPAAFNGAFAQWAAVPYSAVPAQKAAPLTVFDFVQTYPEIKELYDRMLSVSTLISQSRGDKMRKKSAREKLWEAQAGQLFICTAAGAFPSAVLRQRAYQLLAEAEQIVRDAGSFKESFAAYDYNSDGMDEYVLRMDLYTACIYSIGGMLHGLTVLHGRKNYGDTEYRVAACDTVDDGYWRGFFVDHLFSAADFKRYCASDGAVHTDDFPRMRYELHSLSPARREVQLVATASAPETTVPVVLKKKYAVHSGGMTVQYILKNDGQDAVTAWFAVECNFAAGAVSAGGVGDVYDVSVASADEKKADSTAVRAESLKDGGQRTTVSAVQIVDRETGTSFVFEPNENCTVVCAPIVFKRPEPNTAAIVPSSQTLCVALVWHVHLAAGRELEKTIHLSVLSAPTGTAKKSHRPTAGRKK